MSSTTNLELHYTRFSLDLQWIIMMSIGGQISDLLKDEINKATVPMSPDLYAKNIGTWRYNNDRPTWEHVEKKFMMTEIHLDRRNIFVVSFYFVLYPKFMKDYQPRAFGQISWPLMLNGKRFDRKQRLIWKEEFLRILWTNTLTSCPSVITVFMDCDLFTIYTHV